MFKKCNCCAEEWKLFESFMADKGLQFQGYQAGFDLPDSGLFLFNHMTGDCQTTLAVKVTAFRDHLMPGTQFESFQPHTDGCPGHCADHSNLDTCQNGNCNGQVIRNLIQEVKKKTA
jgi:hypothetical protein